MNLVKSLPFVSVLKSLPVRRSVANSSLLGELPRDMIDLRFTGGQKPPKPRTSDRSIHNKKVVQNAPSIQAKKAAEKALNYGDKISIAKGKANRLKGALEKAEKEQTALPDSASKSERTAAERKVTEAKTSYDTAKEKLEAIIIEANKAKSSGSSSNKQ